MIIHEMPRWQLVVVIIAAVVGFFVGLLSHDFNVCAMAVIAILMAIVYRVLLYGRGHG